MAVSDYATDGDTDVSSDYSARSSVYERAATPDTVQNTVIEQTQEVEKPPTLEETRKFAWKIYQESLKGTPASRPSPPGVVSSRSLKNLVRHGGLRHVNELYDAIVYVIVGPEKQKFGVLKGLLCQYSSFFRAALQGRFKEAEEGLVELPDEDPALFKIFNTWLYCRQLVGESDDGAQIALTGHQLSRLFVFGDMLEAPALKNHVVDNFIRTHSLFNYELVPYVYANTLPSSPLRKIFVDLVVWRLEMGTGDKGAFSPARKPLDLPKEYLIDLCIARDKMPKPFMRGKAPFAKTRCPYRDNISHLHTGCMLYYHEHPEEGVKPPPTCVGRDSSPGTLPAHLKSITMG